MQLSFLHLISKHRDAYVPSCHNFKKTVAVEIGLVCSYSLWTAISTPLYLWNWWHSKCCCFSDPYSMVDGVQLPSETTATSHGSDMWCLGLYCCAEGSTHARDCFFGPLEHHTNERVEMAVCEWFRMQEPFLTEFAKLCETGTNASMLLGITLENNYIQCDVWLNVHRNSMWIRNQLDVTFV